MAQQARGFDNRREVRRRQMAVVKNAGFNRKREVLKPPPIGHSVEFSLRPEKALRQRHSVAAAYWQLVETAQEGVWSVDAAGKTVFANENMAAILGTSPGEMIGKSILPFVPREKKDELLDHLLQREQGPQEHFEFPFLRADGLSLDAAARITGSKGWTAQRLSGPGERHHQTQAGRRRAQARR